MLLPVQNANLAVVQEEWFRVSSHKLSSAHQVEDYLSSINEISHRLLEYIVNLVDSNVSFVKMEPKDDCQHSEEKIKAHRNEF